MATETLTPERVLEAAEEVLRRYGPAKANVVDVARALGVGHGSVYRHFPSKAALRDAVTERWLASISEPLEAVANGKGPAPARLQRWLDLLVSAKRSKALADPAHAPEWSNPGIDAAYERVRALVLNGLTLKRSRRAR